MKKRIVGLICIGVLAGGLLAGCGSNSDTDTTEEASAATEEASATEEETTEETTEVDVSNAEYTLTVQSHDPESSATGRFLNAWAAEVEEAAGGQIDVQVYHGATMGAATDTLDMIRNGTCDIGWGLQSFFSDTFPVTEVFQLPMIDITSATQGSNAIWNFYNDYDYMADEYSEYHVLLFHTNCQSPISTVETKIESVSDFSGMQLRANAGPPTDFVTALGATPASCAINDLYSNLEKGVMDGCLTDFHGIYSFSLEEVIPYMLDANIGVSTYFMLMNQDSYDALPEDLQTIIDDASANSLQYTVEWDEVEEEMREELADVLYTLDDDGMAELQAVADGVIEDWIDEMTAAGYDGQAIYDAAMEEIEAAAE